VITVDLCNNDDEDHLLVEEDDDEDENLLSSVKDCVANFDEAIKPVSVLLLEDDDADGGDVDDAPSEMQPRVNYPSL